MVGTEGLLGSHSIHRSMETHIMILHGLCHDVVVVVAVDIVVDIQRLHYRETTGMAH